MAGQNRFIQGGIHLFVAKNNLAHPKGNNIFI